MDTLLLTDEFAACSRSLANSISILAWIFCQSTSTWTQSRQMTQISIRITQHKSVSLTAGKCFGSNISSWSIHLSMTQRDLCHVGGGASLYRPPQVSCDLFSVLGVQDQIMVCTQAILSPKLFYVSKKKFFVAADAGFHLNRSAVLLSADWGTPAL